MTEGLNEIQAFPDVAVYSNIALSATLHKKETEKDVYEYEFWLEWEEEQAKDRDSRVVLRWDIPCIDVQYMWHPDSRARRVLDADWRLHISSRLTGSAPMAMLFNAEDLNTFTFAADEIRKTVSVQFGVDDRRNAISGEIGMGLKQFTGRHSDKLLVRADFRKIPYYKALDDVRAWWEKALPVRPMEVPDIARMPMYSSWYNFHQDITAGELEGECIRAKALGLDTIIVDDGWQTEDRGGGYGFTGDWEVCPKKIPDMRAHVQRVHEAGLKYILWYSVPFIGFYSKNWEQFKDKMLYRVERNSAGVLDPRYPEVREFLTGIYENALREYGLDGFKLDFVDRFQAQNDDEARPGMDCLCVQEATEKLMTDIMLRLKALKPDIMIEFRQSYIGPGMRQFGNMFRVGDCPEDITTNRVGIVDLRLLSGKTAVHSDMITWNDGDSAEDAALQVLNTIFGVTQFSKKIGDMTPEHKEMAAFWLGFERENRKLLQESELIPYEPHFLYPVIKACDGREEIIAVYAGDKILYPNLRKDRIRIINATKQEAVYLSVAEERGMELKVFDCRGRAVAGERMTLRKGIEKICVPRSGLLELIK